MALDDAELGTGEAHDEADPPPLLLEISPAGEKSKAESASGLRRRALLLEPKESRGVDVVAEPDASMAACSSPTAGLMRRESCAGLLHDDWLPVMGGNDVGMEHAGDDARELLKLRK